MGYLPFALVAVAAVAALAVSRQVPARNRQRLDAVQLDPVGWLRSRIGDVPIDGEVYTASVAGRAWRGREGALGSVMVAATRDVFYAEATRWGFGPTPAVTIWRNQVPELLERGFRITDPAGVISVKSVPEDELPNALMRLGWLRPPPRDAAAEPPPSCN